MLIVYVVILQTKPTVLLTSARVDYLGSDRGQNGQDDGTRLMSFFDCLA